MISIAPSSTFLRRSVHLKVRNLFPPYPLDATPAKVLLLLNKTGNNDKNATDGWENVADSRLYTRYMWEMQGTTAYLPLHCVLALYLQTDLYENVT